MTDSVKGRVIGLLKQKDKGVRGALYSYQDDGDVAALRNRIIPKLMTNAREATADSVNTAIF